LTDQHQHVVRQLLGPGLFFTEDGAEFGKLFRPPLADEGFDGKTIKLRGARGIEVITPQQVGEHL
jgi:hypothetical protein